MTTSMTVTYSSAPPPATTAAPRPRTTEPEADSTSSAKPVRDPATESRSAQLTPSPLAGPVKPDIKTLAGAVEELNQSFNSLSKTNIQFSLDDESGEMVVKVMDVEKEEMIRQIPPEEILALVAFLKEQRENEFQKLESAVHGAAPGSAVLDGLLLRATI